MDTDIKIFGQQQYNENLEEMAAQTEQLRQAGLLDAAKRLGRELAGMSAKSPEVIEIAESFGFALTPAREQHLQVLMVYSAQYALRKVLQPALLAEAAVTTMNNTLINHSREFWCTISDGSAFTQYLLAKRETPETTKAQVMGKVFARVCAQEDNTDLHRLGETVFNAAHELVHAKWAAAQ